ncbi:MAG: DUF1816 domain-containing protein [Synechococcales bacterium]|nr:DUF1816 domain-containing protein [Synechococcales bacterium]
MKEMWTSLLRVLGLAWWVEIKTDNPRCTYYFGPFSSSEEADAEKPGYIEDLEQEGATNIRVSLMRGKPTVLTIYEEKSDAGREGGATPAFSGQA